MTIVNAILSIFSGIGDWITTSLNDLMAIFWNSSTSELTFLGVLAVCGLGFSVIFMIVGVIQRFLHFRG